MMFSPEIRAAIRAHAAEDVEVECCGIITAEGYEPQQNVHETPDTHFRMTLEVAERIAAGEVLAVVHSHTSDGFDHASIEDQQQALAMGIPWGLCLIRHGAPQEPFFWGEGVETPPLMPRNFRWGPSCDDGGGDCYALVRDWYALHGGLILPDVPRDQTWDRVAPASYVDGWKREGFRPAPFEDLRVGDALMMAINGPASMPNHAGIYLGGDMILHILRNRLAERAPLGFWMRSIVMALRPPAAIAP